MEIRFIDEEDAQDIQNIAKIFIDVAKEAREKEKDLDAIKRHVEEMRAFMHTKDGYRDFKAPLGSPFTLIHVNDSWKILADNNVGTIKDTDIDNYVNSVLERYEETAKKSLKDYTVHMFDSFIETSLSMEKLVSFVVGEENLVVQSKTIKLIREAIENLLQIREDTTETI